MRYTFHYPGLGLQFIHDTELTFTHIVMGQRDEAADRDKLPKEKLATALSAEQLAQVKDFTFNLTRGWYRMKPIAWAESEEAANAYKAKFEAASWINVSVHPIDPQSIIKHA